MQKEIWGRAAEGQGRKTVAEGQTDEDHEPQTTKSQGKQGCCTALDSGGTLLLICSCSGTHFLVTRPRTSGRVEGNNVGLPSLKGSVGTVDTR